MSTRIPKTLRIAHRIRRRILLGFLVLRAGWGLAVGAGAGLILVAVSKLGWPDREWPSVLASCCALGVLVAWVGLIRKDWSLFGAARRGDVALGLHDRLSSALSLASRAREPTPTEAVAIADGELAAASLGVRGIVPIRLGATWLVAPLLVAVAAAVGFWVPVRSHATLDRASQAANEPAREAAAALIAETSQQARQLAAAGLGDAATADDLRRMDEFQRELLDGKHDPAQALAESAQGLERIAQRAGDSAERAAQTDEALRQQLRDAAADTQRQAEGPVDALDRALGRGDLEGARDAANDLLRQARELSEDQRRQLASELDRLANTLHPAVGSDQPESGEPEARPADADTESSVEQALRSQGIDDPASLEGKTDPAEIQKSLESRGVSPESAQPLAESLAEEARRREAEAQAKEDRRSLSDAARRAAEQLRQPGPPPQDRPDNGGQDLQGDQDRRQQDSPAPHKDGQPAGKQRPEPSSNDGEAPNATQPDSRQQSARDAAPRQSDQGEQSRDAKRSPGNDPGGTPASDSKRAPGRETGAGSKETQPGGEARSGDQREGQPGGQTGQDSVSQQGEQTGRGQSDGSDRAVDRKGDGAGSEPGQPGASDPGRRELPAAEPGREEPGAEPGDAGSARPGGAGDTNRPIASPTPGDGPDAGRGQQDDAADRGGSPERGVEQLRRELDRLASRPGEAERMRDASRSLRERAAELLERASPEERDRLGRLARDMGSQHPAAPLPRVSGSQPAPEEPWRTEPFDARPNSRATPAGPGEVIADWYDKSGAPRAEPGSEGQAPSGPVMDAARGAERAIERQVVPRSRSDLVRRVFERYRRRAESGETPPSAPPGGS